jgi:hypothetical protein
VRNAPRGRRRNHQGVACFRAHIPDRLKRKTDPGIALASCALFLALAAAPQVAEMMNAKLDWTHKPGDAFLASARAQGYTKDGDGMPDPYHGCRYRILKRQGPDAPGGAYSRPCFQVSISTKRVMIRCPSVVGCTLSANR